MDSESIKRLFENTECTECGGSGRIQALVALVEASVEMADYYSGTKCVKTDIVLNQIVADIDHTKASEYLSLCREKLK